RFERATRLGRKARAASRQRGVLDANILGNSFLCSHMAALMGNSDDFVKPIHLGRRVKGERKRKVGETGGHVQMGARLEIVDVVVQVDRAGWSNAKVTRTRELRLNLWIRTGG